MKRKFLMIIPAILLFLVSCEKEGQISCNAHTKDVINGYELDASFLIDYKGNYVTSVETKEIVTSDDEDILSYFDEILTDTYKVMDEEYGGYTHKITKKDNKIISDVTIDYSKMDIKQLVKDQPSYKLFVKNDKILVDGIISIYKSAGATCDE